MEQRTRGTLLAWVRAGSIVAVTQLALGALNFGPPWGATALALAAGTLTLASTGVGILVAVLALSLPILAAAPLIGALYLVVALLSLGYLSRSGGGPFLIIAAAFAGAVFGPAWAAAVLAGYLLGAAEGALAAVTACILLQAFGALTGQEAFGVVVSGSSRAMLDTTAVPANLFSMAWAGSSLNSLSGGTVDELVVWIKSIQQTGTLVAQPILWAAGAAVTGTLARSLKESKGSRISPFAGVAGVLVIALGASTLLPLLGSSIPSGTLAGAAAASMAVAAVVALLADTLFAKAKTSDGVAATTKRGTMADEEADVDELLRLIATAEDKLTTKHTSSMTVMITDMKSFSQMTEEDGSVISAKAIQRHRDLLLPIIERNGGNGKSTGGDGLVAAFADADAAVSAASEMQHALAAHNLGHPDERQMAVRIGLAQGEVILDKGGRPFIGVALNLAARVMNLADGGQAFATADVARKASAIETHSHGLFELRNIAEPVEVVEILWTGDQLPVDPRTRLSA